ncbi:hypothetical protein ACG04R_06735 [Roseateles sp. BYS78W]|uniref:Uncharacterized protein n=1 Tax=Pelomonas candidula TaxID=3299025 RepID=A0ABW7H8X3_9BURK
MPTTPDGQVARIDPEAVSTDDELPAFIAAPRDAPAYYGFPMLDGSDKDGFRFGVITDPRGNEPKRWGDAYVVAPDGSRAGIVWQAGVGEATVICPPDQRRWGVYGFHFQAPIQSDRDLIRCLHSVLPQLKAFYETAAASRPGTTQPETPGET